MENCLWKKVVRFNSKGKAKEIKMNRILFVLLMMTCSVAWADWELLVEDTERKTIWYIEKSSVQREGVISKMWHMTNFLSTRKSKDGKPYKSEKVFYGYDCKTKRSNIYKAVRYSQLDGKGSVVDSLDFEVLDEKWEPIVPGAFDAELWKIACAKK